jgi:hypothetical protein
MANINSLPARFESGGVIQIGSDIVLHVVEGTLERVNPFTDKIRYKDRGALVRPREGDAVAGTLRFDVRYTCIYAASELEGLIGDDGNDGSNSGLAPEKTVVIKYPTYRGASTGYQFTNTKCYFVGAARIVAGSDADRLTVEMECHEAWAYATY